MVFNNNMIASATFNNTVASRASHLWVTPIPSLATLPLWEPEPERKREREPATSNWHSNAKLVSFEELEKNIYNVTYVFLNNFLVKNKKKTTTTQRNKNILHTHTHSKLCLFMSVLLYYLLKVFCFFFEIETRKKNNKLHSTQLNSTQFSSF